MNLNYILSSCGDFWFRNLCRISLMTWFRFRQLPILDPYYTATSYRIFITPLQYRSVGYGTYVSSLKTYVVGRERRMIDSVVGSSQP